MASNTKIKGTTNLENLNVSGTITGNLKGNADTATKATQDNQGQQINTTYVKGITSSNATLTITKGNGTSSTTTINNVANATNATKATQDSQGQQINTTYIKSVTGSNANLTITKGNNTTSTVTVNNVANATLATTARQVDSGNSQFYFKSGNGDVDENNVISQNKANVVIGSWYSTGFRDLCGSGTPIHVAINHRNGNIKTTGNVTANHLFLASGIEIW